MKQLNKLNTQLERIISGGQTGVDQGALLAANALGLETGGWAPNGWLTEDGPAEEFMRSMGMKECQRLGYPARTELNVKDSDATLLISLEPKLTSGSYDTMCCCESLGKPYMHVYICCVRSDIAGDGAGGSWLRGDVRGALDLQGFLTLYAVKTLNVAGPRASKWPEGCELSCGYLIENLSY